MIYNEIKILSEVPHFNYFKQYISCIDIHDSELIDFIDEEYNKIDKEFVKDAALFASMDIPRDTRIEKDEFEAYILYLILMSIYQDKYVKEYRINTSFLKLEGKSRPDTFIGVIIFNDNTEIDITCKPVNKYGYNRKLKVIIDNIVEKNVPIPYHIDINDFIILEQCDPIRASIDYMIDVYKDLINQFKSINKFYWVTFFTYKDIGKSRHVKGRYFLYNFDSLVINNDKKYSYKTQINRIVEVLKEIYGNNKGTSIVSDFLASETDNYDIFDNCISLLMQLKIE